MELFIRVLASDFIEGNSGPVRVVMLVIDLGIKMALNSKIYRRERLIRI